MADLRFIRPEQMHASPARPEHLGVGGGPARPRSYLEGIALGRAGHCAQIPTCLHAIFDNSASVTGGNDPVGQRFAEAAYAVDAVGRRCRCGKDLVAVTHFDHPTSLDLAPTPIGRDHRDAITAALAVPPDGGGRSVLGRALPVAFRHAEALPDHRHVLAVLSDYELFDDVLDDLIRFPGEVFALVVRAQPPHRLIEAEEVTVVRVDQASRPGTLARAIFTGLVAERPGAAPIMPEEHP